MKYGSYWLTITIRSLMVPTKTINPGIMQVRNIRINHWIIKFRSTSHMVHCILSVSLKCKSMANIMTLLLAVIVKLTSMQLFRLFFQTPVSHKIKINIRYGSLHLKFLPQMSLFTRNRFRLTYVKIKLI